MTKHNNIYKHGRKSYQYDWFYHSKAWKKLRAVSYTHLTLPTKA
ncbi:hypothetical protein JMUB7555_27150 [Staphylococcus aureus]